jgi:hypothetical protein
MAFTRFKYDDCRTKKALQQTTDPGRWILNVPGNGDKPCYMEDPQIIPQKWGANLRTNTINLESDLRGQTRLNSLCPSAHYMPECKNCNNKMNGIPCSEDKCKPKLMHQPSCQMQYYPRVPMPVPNKPSKSCSNLFFLLIFGLISPFLSSISLQNKNLFL